uniref:Alpha-defensin N-terminal domain-containing protein n=1 Tax=Castor canadensis TaxID=51338 RepID=A0A8C0VWM3_CASCN
MRTLFFLTAILLLTLQAHSDPLPARVEEPSVQEQMEEVDTVITIFFTGVESSHFRDANKREGPACLCRRGGCHPGEHNIGRCISHHVRMCCH